MVAYQGSQTASLPITEAVGRLKTVPPTGGFVRTARGWGFAWATKCKIEPGVATIHGIRDCDPERSEGSLLRRTGQILRYAQRL